MPYSVADNHTDCGGDKPHAVVNDTTGKVEGCHATPEAAAKQIAALMIAEKQAGEPNVFIQFRQFIQKYLPRLAGEIIAPSPDAEYNSLMVSIPLDADVAARLAVSGGEPAETLHITLAWAGDARQMGDDVLARAIVETAAIARRSKPLVGKIGGVAKFSPDPDGRTPVVALVDVPGLAELRTELVACLKMAGCPVSEMHGFTAHITLRYDESETGELPGIEKPSLLLNSIAVSVGDKQAVFPLQNWMGYQDGMQMYSDHDLMHLAGHGGTVRLFHEVQFMEPPDWIPYLPIPGEYEHPEYGDIVITPQRNSKFVNQFKAGVYQDKLPVDAEHETKLSGALAWIEDMRLNPDGSADARVAWTDRGKALIEGDAFAYFSPEWYEEWTDPASGKKYQDVAIGGALTTRPFFKSLNLAQKALVASERRLLKTTPAAPEQETPNGGPTMADEQKFVELEKKLTEQATQFAELKTQLEGEQSARQAAEATAKTLAEQNTALTDRVTKMEQAARRKRFNELVDGDAPWYGAVETHVGLLETMADTFGEESEQFKTYVSQQQAQAKALADSALFQEQGSNRRNTSDDPVVRVNQMAEAKMKAGNLTLADAQAQVFQENPALYEQYRQRTAVKV